VKKYFTVICFFLSSITLFAQTLDDLNFGTDNTFEVVTWNIEWFPKNGLNTINYVSDIVEALDVDVLAIQEIDDRESFQFLLDELPDYSGFYIMGDYLGLGYIYKTASVQINSIYEIYTSSQYWSPFPRAPYVMDLMFMGENYIIINNHYKCCDGSEARRLEASNLLKDFIDINFPNEQVILLGDLNDVLTDIPEDNVFQSFIDDSDNYLFADMEIAQGSSSNWSFPNWPSHLDHILITNELFDEFGNTNSSIETLKIENYLTNGWNEYDSNVSDHRPVGLKLPVNSIGIADYDLTSILFNNYPNPASAHTTFSFKGQTEFSSIEIYTHTGQQIANLPIHANQNSLVWNTTHLPKGIYFASLKNNRETMASLKLVII